MRAKQFAGYQEERSLAGNFQAGELLGALLLDLFMDTKLARGLLERDVSLPIFTRYTASLTTLGREFRVARSLQTSETVLAEALSRTANPAGALSNRTSPDRLPLGGGLSDAGRTLRPDAREIVGAARRIMSAEDALVLRGDAVRALIVRAIGDAAQPSVRRILALDPEARIGFRGSVASGLKHSGKRGPNGERVAFDGVVVTKNGLPYHGKQGYDADFFVVSDKLADQIGSGLFFRDVSELDVSLKGVFKDFGTSLRSNPLLTGWKAETPTFRVFTSRELERKLAVGDPQIYFISERR
jgi:hypothetical protein